MTMSQIKSKLSGFLFSMLCYSDFSLYLGSEKLEYFETLKDVVIDILTMALGLFVLLLYDCKHSN